VRGGAPLPSGGLNSPAVRQNQITCGARISRMLEKRDNGRAEDEIVELTKGNFDVYKWSSRSHG
jgi:hypothetical protein